MLPRATSSRALRSLANELSTQAPGWLHALRGTERQPITTAEFAVDDPEDLVGYTADPSWRGIALILGGRAHDLESSADIGSERAVTLSFVLDRRGRCAVAIRCGDRLDEVDRLDGVSGFVADVALRILGLGTTPEPCSTSLLFLSVWLRNLLDRAADPSTAYSVARWSDAVDLHPAFAPAGGIVADDDLHPSCDPDDIAAITVELARQLPWDRLRRLAGDGTIEVPGLSPAQARWMDWPFFARWALDVHRPVDELLDDLSLFVDGGLLRDVRFAVEAVGWSGLTGSRAS